MDVLVPGIFGFAGVAVGAGLTYLTQARMARRAEHFESGERLRRERLEIYSNFAAAAMETQRAQVNRWHKLQEFGSKSQEYRIAEAEAHQARNAARREWYRVQLVADSSEISDLARRAVDLLGEIHKPREHPGHAQPQGRRRRGDRPLFRASRSAVGRSHRPKLRRD